MINHIETFTKKAEQALDRNLKIQDMLSDMAMRVDTAHDYQSKLLRYVRDRAMVSTDDMDAFCKANQETLDIILSDQEYAIEEAKNIMRLLESYVMDSFVSQNTLAYMNNINGIHADSKKPLLGKALPAQQYYDDSTKKKGN